MPRPAAAHSLVVISAYETITKINATRALSGSFFRSISMEENIDPLQRMHPGGCLEAAALDKRA